MPNRFVFPVSTVYFHHQKHCTHQSHKPSQRPTWKLAATTGRKGLLVSMATDNNAPWWSADCSHSNSTSVAASGRDTLSDAMPVNTFTCHVILTHTNTQTFYSIFSLTLYWLLLLLLQVLYGHLCGTTRVRQYQKNIHSLTHILTINHTLSASSIYCDPWHPPCSIYVLDSLFAQPPSKSSWSTSWSDDGHLCTCQAD